jgi:hypothetical protein
MHFSMGFFSMACGMPGMVDASREPLFTAVATSSFVLHWHRWEASDHRCCSAVFSAATGTRCIYR